jgi:hypothetical protein
MFDALLYCQVMADIRHGYFLMVADFVRAITAQFRAPWQGRRPVVCPQREAWMQSLARLDNYVASMA